MGAPEPWGQGCRDGLTHITITDDYDDTSYVVDRQILTKETSKNSAYATDFDIIFTHHMPMYQGIFEMKVLNQLIDARALASKGV